nr:ABC transporter ATP-binding protein [Caldimonas mangrovi]
MRLVGITKRFGALTANDDITLSLGRGEVLALLGENGAGKSTLVSILFGHYAADAGRVEVFGRTLPSGDPRAALAAGVGMVHQHFALADNLSVLDNVMLGLQPLWQPWLRRRQMRERLAATARRFGLAIDADARVGDLSVGERQRVEIVKALVRGARILILDEPTAVLTPQESHALFDTLRQLVAEGLAIVFISHKLDEVLAVSDRVAVLRGGRLVTTRPAQGVRAAELAELMVGRSVERPSRAARAQQEAVEPVLVLDRVELRRAGARPMLDRVSLELRPGEVFAVAGVSGNGQDKLAAVLGGGLTPQAGRIVLAGRDMPAAPRAWVDAGVARIPADRQAVGVVGELPLWLNAVLERLHTRAYSRLGFVRRSAAHQAARQLVQAFDVRGGSLKAPVRALSGGNMQKLVLGRALDAAAGTTPVLVVAHQPTWGLDVGAVSQVHRALLEAAARSAAVLLISEDLDEIFALADRVAVMSRGRLGEPRAAQDWSLGEIGLAMAGRSTPAPGPEEGAHAAAAAR